MYDLENNKLGQINLNLFFGPMSFPPPKRQVFTPTTIKRPLF